MQRFFVFRSQHSLSPPIAGATAGVVCVATPDVLAAQFTAALALSDGGDGSATGTSALPVVPLAGSVSLRERIVQAVRVAARRSDMNEEHIRDYAIPAADLAAEASTHVPADVINAGQW